MGPGGAGREEKDIQGLARSCLGTSKPMSALLYLEAQGSLIFSQNRHLLWTCFVSLVLGRVIALSALKTQQGCIPATVRKGSLREARYLPKEQEKNFQKRTSPRNISFDY